MLTLWYSLLYLRSSSSAIADVPGCWLSSCMLVTSDACVGRVDDDVDDGAAEEEEEEVEVEEVCLCSEP